MLSDVYWTDDLSQLWKHPLEFYPIQPSRERRLNAITRLIMYASLAIALVRVSVLPIITGLALAIVAAVVFWRRKTSEVYILSKRKPACRKPTLNNPAMNTPVVEMGKKVHAPCYDERESQDRLLNTYMYADTEDIYANDIAARPFVPLPNGGVYPDFSELANSLAPTVSV